MAAQRVAVVAVLLAAVAIVALKVSARSSPPPAKAPAAADTSASRPAVVLVADLREADSDCGCGRIIRRVRAAQAAGVAVEEVAPDDSDAARRYGVTVVPTVVLLDGEGRVLARREGESGETLAAVSADLSKLEGARR